MVGDIRLKVFVLVFPFVLEEMKLLFKLSGMVLDETLSKKSELKFLEGRVDITGLVELFDACLSRGILHNNLELGIPYSRVKEKLGGSKVIHILE